MKTRHVLLRYFVLFSAVLLVPSVFAAPAAPFEWNVFLGPWQILGPFPSPDHDTGSGLHTDYLAGEPRCNPATAVDYAGQRYEWHAYDRHVLDLADVFFTTNFPNYVVAYARTTFTSDADRDAVLALGSDDSLRAWLNGELVLDHVDDRSSSLDSDKVPVRLHRGENVLLLKVENGYENWGALARLLPAKIDQPLLTFEWRAAKPVDAFRHYELPDLSIEFLDASGHVTARHRVSGYRAPERKWPQYRLYAAASTPLPHNVRIRISDPRYRPVEKTLTWDEAQRRTVTIEAESALRLTGRVLDSQTGQPIADARLIVGETVMPARSDADGRFEIAGVDPLASRLQVAAVGYQTVEQRIVQPLEMKLAPGGKVLRGQILDEDGHPIRDARIRLSMRDPEARDVTDADGRFVLSGLPDSMKEAFPVVEHPDFSPLMSFSEPLKTGATTEVTWKMRRAAVVAGRVIDAATQKPVGDVRVVAGRDRFASNTAIPEATTDSDGRYRLTSVNPGGDLVHAFSDEYAPAMKTVTAEVGKPAEIDFELERGADATGRVVDSVGKPIRDVWLITDTWNGARMFQRETRTDTNGEFRLVHMPATPVIVEVLKENYINQRDNPMTGGQHYDFVLQPVVKHTIRVRLKDSDRVPQDVQIGLGYVWESGGGRTNWETRSSSEGKWDAANAVLTVAYDEVASYDRLYRFRVAGYKAGIVAMPRDAKTAQTLEVVLEPAKTVRGRVVDAKTGAPLAGITVGIVSKDYPIKSRWSTLAETWSRLEFSGPYAVSAADGSFELPVPEPGTDLLLIKTEGGFHYIPDANSVIENGTMELPFPAPATLRGRTLIAGKPEAHESVYIWWRPPAIGEVERQFPFQFGANVPTDGQGRFEITGLGPGRYTLSRVRRFDHAGSDWMTMTVDIRDLVLLPGQTLDFDLDRAAGFDLKGRTLDRDGQPLGDCVVRLDFDGPGFKTFDAVRSDAAGNFTLANVPTGSFRVMAEHYAFQAARTYARGEQDATLNKTIAIAGTTNVEFRLNPIRRAGAPTAGSSVGAIPPDFTATFFNTNGTFTLAEQIGKVVALDFWATWCGPCMAQLPETKKVWEKYRDNPDVRFITVSLDHDTNQLQRILGQKQIDFPVIFSSGGWTDSVAAAFGVNAIPTSFVIGRDGRYASEPTHGGGLAGAIESALSQKFDPALTNLAKLPRVQIEVAFEEDGANVPEAVLEIAGEKLPMPGSATKLRWPYPGGKVQISASAPGVAKQTREITNAAPVSFRFKSPRTIRGQLVVEGGGVSLAGVKVSARLADSAAARSAVSNRDGRFAIPVAPGTYYLLAEGNDKLAAPIPSYEDLTTVDVAMDVDPPEQRITLSRAVTIHGRVVDATGQAVTNAMVGVRKSAPADAAGRFQLSGVPASGPVTIYATAKELVGSQELASVDTNEEYVIELGARKRDQTGPFAVGSKLPELKARPLRGGDTMAWQPARDGQTLVVICALWHPDGRRLLREAIERAKQTGVHLAAFSVDWTPEEAVRHAAVDGVLYLGPGGLSVEELPSLGPANAILVASDGRITAVGKPGQLP